MNWTRNVLEDREDYVITGKIAILNRKIIRKNSGDVRAGQRSWA